MAATRIAIAGGGIGGLTLAIALSRKEISSVVLEKAPAFETVGAGITMQINAMQALGHIGLAEQIEAAGNRLNRLVLKEKTGKVMFVSDMEKPSREFGAPFVGIFRARLHDILCSALTKQGIQFGYDVTEFAENDGEVIVSSNDGQSIEAEALVGADGLRSNVRRQLRGEESLRYSGITSWRGVVDDADFMPLDEACETWGDRSIFGLFPMGNGKLYWFATRLSEPGQHDPANPKELILRFFQDWHRPLPQVVEATPPESILRTDIYDRVPSKPWGKGRVTLLGDSAHPMTPNMGQGGCQAVEDAVILAEILSKADSLEHGFRDYEQRRYLRTKFFVDNSRTAARLSHGMNPLLRFARKWVVPHIPEWLRDRQTRKVFRFEF